MQDFSDELADAFDAIIKHAFRSVGEAIRDSDFEVLTGEEAEDYMTPLYELADYSYDAMTWALYEEGLDFAWDLVDIYEDLDQPTEQTAAFIQEVEDDLAAVEEDCSEDPECLDCHDDATAGDATAGDATADESTA